MSSLQHIKEFSKLLKDISYSNHPFDTFRDFLTMAHISIANTYYKDKDMEDQYLDIAKKYDKEQLSKFSQLLAITGMALAEANQDFLGEVFMSNDMGSSYKGQFFTPYTISLMMSQITIGNGKSAIPKRGWFSVCEPTCGSGGMIIACDQVLKQNGLITKDVMWAQAQDIDPLCFMMCFIQLSLLDIPARVVLGDTLAVEERKVLYTPAFVEKNWFEKIDNAEDEEEDDSDLEPANNTDYANDLLEVFAQGKLF